MQIESLGRVLAEFVGKREHDLSKDSCFSELEEANIQSAFDEYRRRRFEETVDRDSRLYSIRNCPVVLAQREALEAADPFR